MSHDEFADPATSARLQGLIEDITRRLRPVCGAMPEAEFQALVERMARTQYKYEMRAPERASEGTAERSTGRPGGGK
jgi:hypothetical protein